jgi:hypothetical protein
MIYLIIFLVSFAHASVRDCYRQITQADKNECMTYEKDRAIGRFMAALTKKCSREKEVKESAGGTLQSMLLDECLIRELREVTQDLSDEH